MPTIKCCDACGASVNITGKRGFGTHLCPKEGHSCVDDEHKACPIHGTLVWTVGPYSTYRICGSRYQCHARRGKPWRYCAPRGRGFDADARVTQAPDTDTDPHTDTNPSETESQVPAVAAIPTDNVQAALSQLMAALTPKAPTLDAGAIRGMVDELVTAKLSERLPVRLTVEAPPNVKVEIDSPHPYLQRVIRLVNAGIPVYLWGPAGGGKTTAGMQVAKSLGRDSEIDTLDPSTFRSMVQGYCTPTGEPVNTSFTRCWTSGKVYIADEADNAPGHVQTLFNSALANGHAPLAWGNVERGEGFSFIATGNTPGRPTREFPDRKPMSAAFADRLYFVHWPLDEHSERQWSGVGGKGKSIPAMKAREVTADAWVDFVQKLREWAMTNAPTLMITPRASIVGLRALQCGESPEMVADALIFRGADSEIKSKALNAVELP